MYVHVLSALQCAVMSHEVASKVHRHEARTGRKAASYGRHHTSKALEYPWEGGGDISDNTSWEGFPSLASIIFCL